MDIGLRVRDRSFLFGATLALVLLGLGLSFLTFQSLRLQRQTVEEHMFLASQSILRGIEGALSRELRMQIPQHILNDLRSHRALGPLPPPIEGFPGEGTLDPMPKQKLSVDIKTRMEEIFSELVSEGDVEFIAFYGHNGSLVTGVTRSKELKLPPLPKRGWNHLEANGFWAAMYTGGKNEVFVSGIRLRPSLAHLCTLDPALNCPPGSLVAPVLVVGLDPGKHLENFNKFKRAALLQMAYVLVVALFLWGLAVAYLRRRDQGKALHRLETFHSRLLDTMPDGLVTLDCEGVVQAANPAATRLLGDGKDLVGKNWDALPLSIDDAWKGMDLCAVDTGWVQCEAQGRSLELLSVPIPDDASEEDEAGEHLILVRDRTQLKALEEDLSEAKRLAAIGRLAAGLAHEIRNPLSALRGFAQFFQKKLKGKEPEEQYADTMVREADRLDKVITDLLFLSRPREPELTTVYLEGLAQELRRLLRFDLEHAHVKLTLDIAAIQVQADGDMLKQALLNLVLNSLAALTQVDEPRRIRLSSAEQDGMVIIGIADNGPGMSPEAREHALEPFYTSKKQGTGLGLAIVHRIMRDHAGHLEIHTKQEGPDRGTQVLLYLPAHGAAIQENRA